MFGFKTIVKIKLDDTITISFVSVLFMLCFELPAFTIIFLQVLRKYMVVRLSEKMAERCQSFFGIHATMVSCSSIFFFSTIGDTGEFDV